MRRPKAPELRLLLACARAHTTARDEAAIRQLLEEGIDWTGFARKSVGHGLAGLAGHTLIRLAPDTVPEDIRCAFQAFIEQTRNSNRVLLEELAQLVGSLADRGVETIPFKGPVLAMQAFGDLGLRGFRDLDLLIRDRDKDETVRVLCDKGYDRQGRLTEAQFRLIHRLQGQEIMFKPGVTAVEPHTRLTSLKMALDIDYEGLWQRARRENIFGHQMLSFAPEDTLLVLAIHGGKELWWDIKWACDIADFIAAHPGLDWNAVTTRARQQGCYRMLLVATSLAQTYLGAQVPDFIAAAQTNDHAVEQIISRILARWEADDPGGPPSNKTLSMDRLRLHDGFLRRAGYVVRTLVLPGPQHVPLVALPESLNLAYIPIGIVHDRIALPLYRAYEWTRAQGESIGNFLALSPIALALTPISREKRKKLRGLQQAREKALRLVAADPRDHTAWIRMGDALSGLRRHRRAIACYDQALALMPDQNSVWRKRGSAIAGLRKSANLPGLKEAPAFDHQDANGWALQAGFLAACEQHAEAAEASEQALRLQPEHAAATRIGICSRLLTCDWSKRESDKRIAREALESGQVVIKPFNFKSIFDSEVENFLLAQLWAKGFPQPGESLWRGERYQHERIRIAYISTDFRSHPVGLAMAGCFEQHDRTRFEITAVSLGPDDGSRVRKKVQTVVDRFLDARTISDGAVAAKLRGLEIDIAVDLNGLTGAKRPGILARRPAPVQVNYLGYPGTMAAPFIDYIIADPFVIPAENQIFFSEKVAYLPNAYLPYDSTRQIAEETPDRSEEGLPQTGFVFACFNTIYKISPEIFDVWMRLLKAVEGSVLWLPGPTPAVIATLRQEAQARGVAPERLVFARYAKRVEDHLARHRLADLFLDTLPYNAHSTGGDALWAGLPLLTCMGQAFPGRVAAGLLHAVGLPEMVTDSLADYEARALFLAHHPEELAAIRKKLADNRASAPLFDTPGFTRHLEAIFTTMRERQESGLPPDSFSVAAG
jgi:predicted O-linked N-acetylglucosamine transferase (SPINDLY family)